jgi:hypothetical protein
MNSLICTETGALDIQAVKARALTIARREYGGVNPPPALIRRAFRDVWSVALVARELALKATRNGG